LSLSVYWELMANPFYKKLDGLPAAIIGILLFAGAAYYIFLMHADLEDKNAGLLNNLSSERDQNYELLKKLEESENIIASFQGQISNITNTVGTLEKLAQTDEELLKKYSKIYFLNENYTPAKLREIDKEYIYNGTTNFMILSDVWPHLSNLLEDARDEDVDLVVASAFRSFDAQKSLKSEYKVLYGTGANQFSADQGYSEHQLGTALDFTTSKLGGNFSKFETDPAFKWLQDNAHKYGFILSYPKGNTYYKFEPWHWRYVGVELARRLHDDQRFFYDLDQREIDTYLIKLFD